MATTPHRPTPDEIEERIALQDQIIEALCTAGFNLAADLTEAPAWLAERNYAAQPHGDGWIVANLPDPEAELTVAVLTASGVIRSEARFDVTELGLAMMVGAVAAVTEAR